MALFCLNGCVPLAKYKLKQQPQGPRTSSGMTGQKKFCIYAITVENHAGFIQRFACLLFLNNKITIKIESLSKFI